MKKEFTLMLLVVALIPGCAPKKSDEKKTVRKVAASEGASSSQVVAVHDYIKEGSEADLLAFLENESGQMAALEDSGIEDQLFVENDFSWLEDASSEDAALKAVYFEFNQDTPKNDQADALQQNIAQLNEILVEAEELGIEPTIVVEGNACSSAGSSEYNLLLSEKRAHNVSKQLVDAGIPEKNISIVGRGSDAPVLVDGAPLTGNRAQQGLNRRAEFRVTYT